MYQSKWFKALVVAILIALLFLLFGEVGFVFDPVIDYITAVAFPFAVAGVLYYITRPVVKLLDRFKIPRIISILLIFVLMGFIIFLISRYIAPIVQDQFTRLYNNLPQITGSIQDLFNYWKDNQQFLPEQVNSTLEGFIENIENYAVNAISLILDFISQLANYIFALFLVPFFLFFLLKDGEKLRPFVTKFLSKEKAKSVSKLMSTIDNTLSAFILGQLTVSICVGVMLYIGYIIIGLNYSLTLAVFAMATNVIPFIGPFIAAIPAILVGVFQDPIFAVYITILMIIAQQIEGNLISPNIMGKVLNIHPLTIITLILAAGNIAGFLGLLIVIPVYAVAKAIISHFYHEWREKHA
ncbi:AI-2E family transporter [Bacillaceae bacterium S4-13-56]